MQLRSLSESMQPASFSWWHYSPLLCSVSNCEGWSLPATGLFKLLNTSAVMSWTSAFSEWELCGYPLSASDISATRAWIEDTSGVTSQRLKLKCWCGASSMTRSALRGLLEMVTSSVVHWQTGTDSIWIMASVLTRGRSKKISAQQSFTSWHSPSGGSSHAKFILECVWVFFGLYKSKLDIFSNRSNSNNPLPVICWLVEKYS